jgi:hypothetical protein
VEAAGGDIHCGFTPCISNKQKNKSFQPTTKMKIS